MIRRGAGVQVQFFGRSRAPAIMAYLRNKSMEFLKRFEVPAKNPSEDAQRRWREAVGTLVKNRRRRFRMVPDLDKRSQVETQRRKIQVRPSRTNLAGHLISLLTSHAWVEIVFFYQN